MGKMINSEEEYNLMMKKRKEKSITKESQKKRKVASIIRKNWNTHLERANAIIAAIPDTTSVLKVLELKALLANHGLNSRGNKEELIQRWEEFEVNVNQD